MCGGDRPGASWVAHVLRARLPGTIDAVSLFAGTRQRSVTAPDTHRGTTAGRAEVGSRLRVHETRTSFLS